MDNSEYRAYNLLERLNSRKKAKYYAQKAIQTIFLYKKKQSSNSAKFYLIKLKKYLREFTTISNRLSNTYDPSSFYEMMLNNFNTMKTEINLIKTSQDKLIKHLGIETIKYSIYSKNEIEVNPSVLIENSIEVPKEIVEEGVLQGFYLLKVFD